MSTPTRPARRSRSAAAAFCRYGGCTALISVFFGYLSPAAVEAFAAVPGPSLTRSILPRTTPAYPFLRRRASLVAFMSDVGGGGDGGQPPGGKRGGGPLDGFLEREGESDGIKRAREAMSEDSLPISFGYEKVDDAEDEGGELVEGDEEGATPGASESSADDPAKIDVGPDVGLGDAVGSGDLVYGGEGKEAPKTPEEEALALRDNPYLDVVSRLSPSDIISKFTSTADPRVQDAVRTTILGLIGNLPKMGFDATAVTTGERLASLMFQLQMTGYMFKNAEYRLSLTQSLGMSHPPSTYGGLAKRGFLLAGDAAAPSDEIDLEDDDALSGGKVRGKIRVSYGGGGTTKSDDVKAKKSEAVGGEEEAEEGDDSLGMGIEVDAEAYLSEIREEVSRLRDELTSTRKSREDALRKDLLLYIRTLSQDELRGLTGTMSKDILGAMKGLVNVVMAGIGEGKIGPDTVTEQSGEAMAQLCMWQLVVGYNLRELEVREEMRATLLGGSNDGEDENGEASGNIIVTPGTLE